MEAQNGLFIDEAGELCILLNGMIAKPELTLAELIYNDLVKEIQND